MKVLQVLNFDFHLLGYKAWLVVDRYGACDVLRYKETIYNCHPVIPATKDHAIQLGCEEGDLICGVRWIEPFKGQPHINTEQSFD